MVPIAGILGIHFDWDHCLRLYPVGTGFVRAVRDVKSKYFVRGRRDNSWGRILLGKLGVPRRDPTVERFTPLFIPGMTQIESTPLRMAVFGRMDSGAESRH